MQCMSVYHQDKYEPPEGIDSQGVPCREHQAYVCVSHNSFAGGNLAFQWSTALQPTMESWMQLEYRVFLQIPVSHPAIHSVQSYAFENVHHIP